VRESSRQGLEGWITSADAVTFYPAKGRFVGPRQIEVGDEVIEGRQIYINVGARPRIPSIPGLDTVSWLDNRKILELTTLPEHLIILGGSYIGLEFGQVFRRLGARVTVIEQGDQLVVREDRDVADAIQAILEAEGIEFHLGAKASSVAADDEGGIVVSVQTGDHARFVHGSHLLLATGRVPNSDSLALETAGIETDGRGYITVDDHCRTNLPDVFAVGDVNGHGAFTHTSVNDAEIVLDCQRGGSRRLSDRVTTYALFIDPALGRAGLTEKEAVERGHRVLRAIKPMDQISRAKEMGETQGFAKLLVDADTDMILGASILGPGGDEIVNMFSALIYSGLPCRQYRKSVLIHPTISELMPWMLDTLEPVN
jgi:pyruvate/2-oxoglutarate dehydrogenase complex dihydrolipoamide dehydrogenase (E3) component